MSEIVVGDLLTWEPDLQWQGDPGILQRDLSWAVAIRASVPVLPPLRGGELIIVPSRTLSELQRVEMIRWQEVARSLAGQALAGLIVDPAFEGEALPGVPLIVASPELMLDAESRLNRLITEHRAELYRLGSDLSRALSAASIGGADLDALLSVSGQIGHHDILLYDLNGRVLARSRDAPSRLPFSPASLEGHPSGYLTSADGWTCLPANEANNARIFLAAGPGASDTPERVRLVLSQTRSGLEAFLGPDGVRRRLDVPHSRDALLADLLLGNVPAAQIASRSRTLSIDPDEALSLALFLGSEADLDGRIRTGLRRELRERACMLSPGELAVCIPESGWNDWWEELRLATRSVDPVILVRSEQQPGMVRAAHATRQARAIGRLKLAGIPMESSVFDVLLPVWDPQAFEPGPDRLAAYADRLLLPLEQHDRERNGDIVQTLEGYLSAGGSTTGAAELLSVHRNTLGYRLRRIADITGADLDNEDTRLAYGLALRIRKLQLLFE